MLACMIVFILIVEITLSFILPQSAVIAGKSKYQSITHTQKPFYRWALHLPNLRWDFEAHSDYLEETEGVPLKLYSIYTDKHGFILPGPVHDHPDLKIAFFGGSTTENALVGQENRFPYAAGRILENKYKKKINTYNVSKSGISSMNSLNNLMNNALGIRPDIVIHYENINDLATLHRYGSYWNEGDTSRSLIVWENTPQDKISAIDLARYFDGAQLISAAINSMGHKWVPNITVTVQTLIKKVTKDTTSPNDGNHTTLSDKPVPMNTEAISADFRRSLTTFIAVSRIWGAEPVLMTQANRFPEDLTASGSRAINNQVARWNKNYKMEYSDIKRTYDRMNDVIREVAAREHVLLIDLDKRIEKNKENMYDIVHFTDKGSLEAARIIADSLADRFGAQLK